MTTTSPGRGTAVDEGRFKTLLALLPTGKLDLALEAHGWARKDKKKHKPAMAGKGMGAGTAKKATINAPQERLPKQEKGWVTIRKKSGPEDATAAKVPDILVQTGFSAPVRKDIQELRDQGSGVCLASTKQTEEAILEFRAQRPCAVLCAQQLKDNATEVHVIVTDANGREQVRRRYLHLGNPKAGLDTGT